MENTQMPTIQENEAIESLMAMRDPFAPDAAVKESGEASGRRKMVRESVSASVYATDMAGDNAGGKIAEERDKKRRQVEEDWRKAKDKKIGDEATLGDFAATQKFMSYYEPLPEPVEMFAAYVGVSIDKMAMVRKEFPRLMSSVVRHALGKVISSNKGGSYSFEEVRAKIGGKEYVVATGLNRMVAIETGPDQTTQVPSEPTLGAKTGGKKIVFALRESYTGMTLTVFAKAEADTQDFVDWITQLTKRENYLKGAKIDGQGKFLRLEKLDWDDIVLPRGVREKIETNVINLFRMEHVYLINGIPPKRGYALVGPPGTGKTLLTKVMAAKLDDVTFIWVVPSSLSYGSGSIADIYDLANELAPTIVFFEDADVYLGQRGSMESGGGILTELMNRLDGVVPVKGVVTGISSNRPEVIETALIKRPGRFDLIIELGAPDSDGRLTLLAKYFSKVKIDPSQIDELAKDQRIAAFTPNALHEVARRSILKAIEEGSYDKKTFVATVSHTNVQDALGEILDEQSTKGNYIQEDESPRIAMFRGLLESSGLQPLGESTIISESRRGTYDKVRAYFRLVAPDSISDDTLYNEPIAENDELRKIVDTIIEERGDTLADYGVRKRALRLAKKIRKSDDVTIDDLCMTLSGRQ
jgi:cell division protease FtsH